MSGPALHHLIAETLMQQILRGAGPGHGLSAADRQAIADALQKPENMPWFFLGCQGPDFLFFNTKDMPGPIHDLATAYLDVTDTLEDIRRTLLDLVPQPVLDALAAFDEAANEVITSSSTLSEIQQLFGNLQQVLDGLTATITEAVKRFLAEFAVFSLVGHPYGDGTPKGAKPAGFDADADRASGNRPWWWFDALHYRKTGQFAQFLLDNSAPGTPEHLYALGYLTHVSADVVGHPYVNTISGGPYRSHAQRHKSCENYQDVQCMLAARGTDWNRSKLHALYNFNFTGPIDTENDVPDPFTHLPPDLAELILAGLDAVYEEDGDPSKPEYGQKLDPDELNDTYRLWYRWLKSTTESGTLPVPVPYSLTAELREVWDKAMDNLGDVGDFIEDASNQAGSMGIWGIFLLLAALVLAAVMAAAAIVDAVLGALTTLGTATIRYAACLAYEQVYNAWAQLRLGVAMNGLAFPLPEHLTDGRIRHFGNPALADRTSRTGAGLAGQMPLLEVQAGAILHGGVHLIYPPALSEAPPVFTVPSSYLGRTALWYAFGDIPLTADLDALAALGPSGDPDGDAGQMAQLLGEKQLLGNALALHGALYDQALKGTRIPDFNLDGDRGYGWLCWQSQSDKAVDYPDPVISQTANPGLVVSIIR